MSDNELKSDIKVLASSMHEIKDVVKEMGHTLSNLVSIDVKTNKNEKDIQVLFRITRDIEKVIENKSDEHFDKCEERSVITSTEIKSDIRWYLAGVFSLIAIVYYTGLTTADDVKVIKDIVVENKVNINNTNSILTKHVSEYNNEK